MVKWNEKNYRFLKTKENKKEKKRFKIVKTLGWENIEISKVIGKDSIYLLQHKKAIQLRI